MSGTKTVPEDLARQLQDSVRRLHQQAEKVEFWAEVISGFAQPVPEYEPESTKIGRYVKPSRAPRKRRRRRSSKQRAGGSTPASA